MQIKLCGFTDKESIQTAIAQKCDFIGFVFCKESSRFITPEKAAEISDQIPNSIKNYIELYTAIQYEATVFSN